MAFNVIDKANAVLPWLDSPAIMIKSLFCNPPFSSNLLNPVGVPIILLLLDILVFTISYTLLNETSNFRILGMEHRMGWADIS